MDWLSRRWQLSMFFQYGKKKRDEWTETGQIAFIHPPCDANYPCMWPNDRAALKIVFRDGWRVLCGHHYKHPVTYGARPNMPTHTVAGQIWLQPWGQDKLPCRVSLPDESCGYSTRIYKSVGGWALQIKIKNKFRLLHLKWTSVDI